MSVHDKKSGFPKRAKSLFSSFAIRVPSGTKFHAQSNGVNRYQKYPFFPIVRGIAKYENTDNRT